MTSTSTTPTRRPLAGLLTAQFFGAFNDNAMKLMVALLAGGVAAQQAVQAGANPELARQEQTTIAFVVFTLPLMLFSLPSALIADRLSKRTVIIAMKVLEVAIMALGALILFFNPAGGWVIFVMLALMGLQSAIFSPAKYGIMPDLCDEATITRGNGLLELWTFVAIIGGYAAGGLLLEWQKPESYPGMLVLVALSVVGLVASFGVPRVPAAAAGGDLTAPLRGGWQAIRRSRTLKLVIAGQTVFWMIASLLSQDVLTYSKEFLKVDDLYAGVPFAAFGVGIGIGSVVAGRISNHRIEPGLIPIGAIGLALGAIAMGVFTPAFWGTMFVMTCLGVASGLLIVPLEAMLQWYSPADRRGAVIAIANVPVFGGVMLGSLGTYWLADFYSSAEILTVAGLATCLATAWALWLLPEALVRMFIVLVTNTLYRLRVEGREHLPEEGGALIVVNHVSLVDGLFLITASSRPIRFLVDSSYFHHWFLRPFMKMLGAIPISAGSPRELMRAMKDAGEYLKEGDLVCIFAEGEITRTGALLPFRRGLTRILKGNESVPVIPAHLDQVWGSPFSSKGGGFLRSWNGPIPRPITCSFGAPLPADTPVEEIRRHVKLLDEQAWRLRAARRPPLHHTFARMARRRPWAHAMSDTTGKRASRLELLGGALLLARQLRGEWGTQTHVGIMLPPSVGSTLANLAAAFSGRVSVNLNYTAGVAGLESSVRQAGLETVITTQAFLDKAGVELPAGLRPILLDEVAARIGAVQRLAVLLRAFTSPVRWLERFAGAVEHPAAGDIVTVIFSSGSTGEPKGVMLSHANIDSNAEGAAQALSVTRKDRVLGILPHFHSFGYMATWFTLNNGLAMACHSNPVDAATIGPMVLKEKVTILIATPTFLQVYMRRCTPGQFGRVRAVITGAEKLSPATADAFEDTFGIRPLEGYGTSECAPVVAVGTAAYRAPGFFQAGHKRGSIGQPLPGVAVEIVDPDTFERLPLGEPGMLLVRGPNVMVGYLGRPDLTEKAMHEGWYVTGDIGVVDEDGYIRITDRLSRFSKIGGEMVPHGRVEDELHKAAGCCEERLFCVTGVPDEKKGERLAVLTTLPADKLPEVLAGLGESGLPNLFIPRLDQFVHVDAVPLLGTGKVDLKRVKAIALEAAGVEA